MAGAKRGQRLNNRETGSYYEMNGRSISEQKKDMKFWNIIIGADSEKSI